MKINLRDVLASEEQCLPLDYSIDFSGEEINFEFPLQKPIHVVGTLQNKSDVFYLDVTVDMAINTHCARCGILVDKQRTLDVSLVIAQSVCGDGADDIIVVGFEPFELNDVIREEIILNMDMVTLCGESCKGLCPKCGQNLNETQCACDLRELDPRLAKLNQLLQDR